MARPTDELKSYVLKCRIGEELHEKLKDMNVSEVAREALERYFKDDNLNSIEGMVKATGGTLDGFLKDLAIKLEWGVLELEEGVIKVE